MKREDWVAFCRTLPGSYEDYPFGEEWTVMRHRENQKSFALLYQREGRLWANLKCEPMEADFLRNAFSGVRPAYHMNKTHWNSVALDGSVPEEEVRRMILHSFELTADRRKR
ncbi:MAG: MmcQ/YjbR family DNA-binding protein [Candidatus Merdivicinus sp.]|jgi:predicted DNA-binding protein (MmcQ/YjbR family)